MKNREFMVGLVTFGCVLYSLLLSRNILHLVTSRYPILTMIHGTQFTGKKHVAYLWEKYRSLWVYLYQNFYDQYDWFINSDDDTYVVVDNLRACVNSDDIRTAANGGIYRVKAISNQGFTALYAKMANTNI
jgi:hypothetical protein